MARIVIADDTGAYTGRTGQEIALGGTESSVIHLAEAFARRGHAVTGLTRTAERLRHNGVDWAPLSSAASYTDVDLYLPVQHPRLFHLVRKPRKLAVWLIWPVNNLRHYKRIPLMWRYRPIPVVASAWLASEYSVGAAAPASPHHHSACRPGRLAQSAAIGKGAAAAGNLRLDAGSGSSLATAGLGTACSSACAIRGAPSPRNKRLRPILSGSSARSPVDRTNE